MKIKFLAFLIILNLVSFSNAENINELEIEGISLGDSALIYFSEKHIKENSMDHYNKKDYTAVQNDKLNFFETYDAVDFNFKSNDKNYTIVSLSGILYYDNVLMSKCYEKLMLIEKDLDTMFSNLEKEEMETFIHPSPRNKSKKSTFTQIRYYFKNNDQIDLTCYDYSEEHGSQDHLSITLQNNTFSRWLIDEAYN